MGEFELALVFYHRGKKLRGDVKEFQLGINKAQEAIDNCVGGALSFPLLILFFHFYLFQNNLFCLSRCFTDPHSVKLEIKGDLSYFDKPDEVKQII